MADTYLKKIVILGTTGSGKTSFLKNLVGDFEGGAEVARRVVIEEAQIFNTFSPLNTADFANSTTTVSMNVKSVLFLTTRSNHFQFYPLENKQLPIPAEDMEDLFPTMIVDTAGQERLSFMQEIGLNGADGVFIFADGTNVSSIERVSEFLKMVHDEESKKNKQIPVAIFVNKKDLESRGIYVGANTLERWIPQTKLIRIYETSNTDIDSFLIPIRNFLSSIAGFPVPVDKVVVKSVHEVYQ